MSLDQTLSRTRGRRRPLRAVRIGRPRLRLLVAVALLAAALAGGWLWLRDSSVVRVREVQVNGLTSSAEPRIRAALESAARTMTTLHVRRADLEQAVAGYPSVAALKVRTDFPHTLAVEVTERRPVALVVSGDQTLPATGDGLLLREIGAPRDVPTITTDSPVGTRAEDRRLLSALAVAGAAPAPLRARTTRIAWGPRGLTAELRDGPPLIFGNREDAAAKWLAAARVLADPTSVGATYLDLRVRGRVAAGGVGPVVEEVPETAPEAPVPGVTATPTAEPSTVG